ncbi:hypothetical protein SF12_13055 [Streptomyces sp. MBRL 601]|nr:hypothetical protein SF12_13055 [Streptomyces sp. MBRL 601]
MTWTPCGIFTRSCSGPARTWAEHASRPVPEGILPLTPCHSAASGGRQRPDSANPAARPGPGSDPGPRSPLVPPADVAGRTRGLA